MSVTGYIVIRQKTVEDKGGETTYVALKVAVVRERSIRIVEVGSTYRNKSERHKRFTVEQIYQDWRGVWRVFGTRNSSRRRQSIKLDTLTASYTPVVSSNGWFWPPAYAVTNTAGALLIDPSSGMELVFDTESSAVMFAEDHADALGRDHKLMPLHVVLVTKGSRASRSILSSHKLVTIR